MGARGLLAICLGLALGACRGDPTEFLPLDVDAGPDVDAPPTVIRVEVTPSMTTVGEGGQTTVQVRLSGPPDGERPVDVTGSALLSPGPARLVFTTDNWDVKRTVILTAGQDDDAVDSRVAILLDGHGAVADGATTVTVRDDDVLAMAVAPPVALGVTEGATATVQVVLTARPSSNVVIAAATMHPARATVSSAQLTFTPGNWDTPQALTVRGTDDANIADASTQLVLDPDPTGMEARALTIDVIDDDVLAIDVSPTNLGVLTEAPGAAHSAMISVRLTQMPSGPLTVELDALPGGTVSLSTDDLTFTPANYATEQHVLVNALDDDDVVDEQVAIRLSGPGMTDRTVQVGLDDDEVQVIQVTPAVVPVLTEGDGVDLGVRLAHRPGGPVVIDVSSSDPGVATADVAQLLFTTADFDQVQTVHVTTANDADLAAASTVISFTAPDGLTTSRPITVDDDDVQGFEVAPPSLTVAENGTAPFTVRLRYQPSGPVMVTIGTASPAITVMPASLTFGPDDYAMPREITVTAIDDPGGAEEHATVTVSSPGVQPRDVEVTVADDDPPD